jgi:hypothetical protein
MKGVNRVKKNKKFMLWVGVVCMIAMMLSGCSKPQEKAIEKTSKETPVVIQETSVQINKKNPIVTQVGYLHGFVDKNLVEFKVMNDGKETLRVFEIGKDIQQYLSKQKQDGSIQFKLTYEETKDGLKNPFLFKIEKINDK